MKLSDVISCVRGDVVAARPVTAVATDTVQSVAGRMREHNVGAIVIVEGRKPMAMVTDRDLALAIAEPGFDPNESVKTVMRTPVRTLPDGAGIFSATQCMRDAGVRRMAVVDKEGNLIGIASFDDLLQLIVGELHNLAQGVKNELKVK